MSPEWGPLQRFISAHPDLFLGGAAVAAGVVAALWLRRKKRPRRKRSPVVRALMVGLGLLVVAALMVGLYALSLRNWARNIEHVEHWRHAERPPTAAAAASMRPVSEAPAEQAEPQGLPVSEALKEPEPEQAAPAQLQAPTTAPEKPPAVPASAVSSPAGAD